MLQRTLNFLRDEDTFFTVLNEDESVPKSPLTESISYIHEMQEQKPSDLPFVLCLSGGIDSECMAQAFLSAQVDFQVVMMKFRDHFNEFDLQTNIQFCQSRKIPYQLIDLDVIDFLESGKYFETALRYECQSPQIASHLWLLEQIDGIPCLAGNPMAPIWRQEQWYFVGLPGELHSTYFKFFDFQNRLGVPWFFLGTPALTRSFLALPGMKPYLAKQVSDVEKYSYLEKCRSYQESGFTAQPREDKFTGFELVRKLYDEKCKTTHGVGFDDLFRKPLERKFPFPAKYVQLVPQNYLETVTDVKSNP